METHQLIWDRILDRAAPVRDRGAELRLTACCDISARVFPGARTSRPPLPILQT